VPIVAEGIPDRDKFGDPTTVRPGSLLDWVVQHHQARRAGPHTDVRFGGEDTGLYSWAVRKGLPQPGQKHLAVQQPLHASSYQGFEGEIPSGYGAGRVTKHDQGQVLVTRAGPGGIHFSTAHRRFPERYALVPYPKAGERQWLLLNNTKTDPIPYQKRRYVKVPADQAESVLANLAPGSSVQEKLDGAASLTKLYKDHAEVVSYRARKDGKGPIVHTERLSGGRIPVSVPRDVAGSVLRGELYGVGPDGRAIAPQRLGGLLNSGIAKSLGSQRSGGVRLKNMLFDAQQYGETPIDSLPYQERRAKLQEVVKHLPNELFHTPREVSTPGEALDMWRGIKGGTNPLTREGVVIHPPEGPPKKIKLTDEHDVHVRGFFPGKGKYHGVGVGGFTYSHEPEGPVAGEVGSGLTDETRRMMHQDPSAFMGRVARVRAQEKLPSGALRAPSLIALHEDLPLAPVAKQAGVQPDENSVKTCHGSSYNLIGLAEEGGAVQAPIEKMASSSILWGLDNKPRLDPDCHDFSTRVSALALRVTQNDTHSGDGSQGWLLDFAKEAGKRKKTAVPEDPTSTVSAPVNSAPFDVLGRDTSGVPENPANPVKSPAYTEIEGLVGGGSGQVTPPAKTVSSTPGEELGSQPVAPRLPVPGPLKKLLAAKAHSDAKRYEAKHAIMRALIHERPSEFVIDSEDRGVVGITHVPTRFRIHLPASAVPAMPTPLRRLGPAA
jgi:hypothetical protein